MQRLVQRYAPPALARAGKRIGVVPRYWAQSALARLGRKLHGHRHDSPLVFIAGLPKSGTSWLEGMVADVPGFQPVMIPDVAAYEMARGESHRYDLPPDFVRRFRGKLAVCKMHVRASHHNVRILHQGGVRYVVLYRDVRDVAVSHYHYVRRTPWHPEHEKYGALELREGLELFRDELLPDFTAWIRDWRELRDPGLGIELRYEEMVEDPESALGRVVEHFGLGVSPEGVREIVRDHSFQRLSGGRAPGQESRTSFFRKGTPGDWRNHFDDTLRREYWEVFRTVAEEVGYRF